MKVFAPLAFAFTQEKIDIYVLGYGSSQLGIGNLRTLAKKAVQEGIKGKDILGLLVMGAKVINKQSLGKI